MAKKHSLHKLKEQSKGFGGSVESVSCTGYKSDQN